MIRRPGPEFSQPLHEFLMLAFFGEKIVCAQGTATAPEGLAVVAGEDQHAARRLVGFDRLQHVQAVTRPQHQIEDDNVGTMQRKGCDCIGGRIYDAGEFQSGHVEHGIRQNQLQSNRVFDEEDFDARASRRGWL
ncbi:MAG: hypothetical protein V4773_10630 [Verrucomicrobiota bacterium]